MSTKKLTIEEVKSRVKAKNPNLIIKSDVYENIHTLLEIECGVCGNIFQQKLPNIIESVRNKGCKKCEKRQNGKRVYVSKTHEQYSKEFNEIHNGALILLGKYERNDKKIEYHCLKCNYNGLSEAKQLISGHGCKKCGHKKTLDARRKTFDEFKSEFEEIHKGCITLLSDFYVNSDTHLDFKCNECEFEWKSTPHNILRRGCPICKSSKGEKKIKIVLDELEINYQQQVLVNEKSPKGGTCFFDFTLNDGIVIEYDGVQHFKAVESWGGEIRLNAQKEVDKFKDDYCLRNNLKMIRIAYWDLNKINKEYILKLIKNE